MLQARTPERAKNENAQDHVAARLADELDRLSAAVRSRNMDASPEVKEAVEVLAVELGRVAATLRNVPTPSRVRDEAAVQSHLAVLDAKDKLSLLEQAVRSALEGAARSSKLIGETAKMKLALAKLEATDLLEENRRRLQQERKRLDGLRAAALREIDDRLARLIGAAMLK